jgi:RNA polymerase sigma-70 factor (ECF subfamily)
VSEAAFESTSPSLLQQLRHSHPNKANEAWRRFVQLYTPLLLLWARRLGAAGPEADDLVQDVFAILVREMPTFQHDPGRRFRGWLWTILSNKWNDRARHRAAGPGFHGAESLEDAVSPDPTEALAEQEYQTYLVARVLEIMQTELPAQEWQACHAYIVEGRPAAEVAGELGLSVNQIYLAKSRILRRLREELQGLLD